MHWLIAPRAWVWLALVVLARFSFASQGGPGDGVLESDNTFGKDLVVGVPLENEFIRVDGPVNAYRPIGLEPLWTYEMRASFVSTRSAQVHFGYECGVHAGKLRHNLHKQRNRRLLHAEKLVFWTDQVGRVQDHPDCLLTVWVTSWGRMRQNTDDFFYDLVLEKNVLGVPASGMPLVAYTLFAVVVILLVGGLARPSLFGFDFQARKR